MSVKRGHVKLGPGAMIRVLILKIRVELWEMILSNTEISRSLPVNLSMRIVVR